MSWFWVFIGGGLGSLARYLLSVILSRSAWQLPWATFLANVLSCILLGILVAFLMRDSEANPTWKYVWMVGFCGGFSTFSTFTAETFQLLQNGHIGLAMLNIGGSILVCLVAFYLGYRLAAGGI